jgi:serine/threonine protein kinase
VHLVEELASGGELFDRIIELGHFSEKEAVHLIHQVFDGIQYLHTHGMIHRDLKPENLLMVGKEPGTEEYMMLKICDFGEWPLPHTPEAQKSTPRSPDGVRGIDHRSSSPIPQLLTLNPLTPDPQLSALDHSP